MGGGLISVQDKTVSVARNWKPEFPSGRLADALTYLGVGVVFPRMWGYRQRHTGDGQPGEPTRVLTAGAWMGPLQ